MNCTVMLASSCEIASPQNLKQIERQSRAEAMEKGSQWQSAVELFSLSGKLPQRCAQRVGARIRSQLLKYWRSPIVAAGTKESRSLSVSLFAVSLIPRALERRRREH